MIVRRDSLGKELVRLPGQPPDVEWPTLRWDRSPIDVSNQGSFNQQVDEVFNLSEVQGVTYALLVIQRGKVVYERYAAGANAFYLQYSWSMAKSITHALVGILAGKGELDIYAPAAVPEWQDDDRAEITLDQLLRMSSGLRFVEDYVDGEVSDVIPMLNTTGRHDTGAFAAAMPKIHEPGTVWSYSSGTTNIICRVLRDLVGNGPSGMLDFMRDELFEPLGMRSPTPKFDAAGTFIGSSYLLATPEDFARFGYLYLRDGLWEDRRILPESWVDYARSETYNDGSFAYGAHWWLKPDDPEMFYASGYDGQRVLLLPRQDAVIVRCGRTPAEESPYVWDRLYGIADLLGERS